MISVAVDNVYVCVYNIDHVGDWCVLVRLVFWFCKTVCGLQEQSIVMVLSCMYGDVVLSDKGISLAHSSTPTYIGPAHGGHF